MQRGRSMGSGEVHPSGKVVEINGLVFKRGGFSLEIPKLEIPAGQKVAVMGENGSGKSTLLAVMAGFLKPQDGHVKVHGVSIHSLSHRERARMLAFLPQTTSVVFPFTVGEVVLMGRYPHLEGREFSQKDHQATEEILGLMDLQELSHRRYSHLSGGEQRRVMLARALNQQTPLLLLDEPVAMLDSRHGLLSLSLLTGWERTVVAVMHDINLALWFFQRFLFLKEGRVIYDIEKEEIDEGILSEVYGVGARRCSSFCFTLEGGSYRQREG